MTSCPCSNSRNNSFISRQKRLSTFNPKLSTNFPIYFKGVPFSSSYQCCFSAICISSSSVTSFPRFCNTASSERITHRFRQDDAAKNTGISRLLQATSKASLSCPSCCRTCHIFRFSSGVVFPSR